MQPFTLLPKPLPLQVKFALYNALSKILIIAAFMAFLPIIVEKVVYDHIDKRLMARSERVLMIIAKGGIDDIVLEQDCSFESYSILKEDFVTIYPILDPKRMARGIEIRNEDWSIEGERLSHRIIRRPFTYDNQMYELNIGEGIGTIEQLKTTINKLSFYIMLLVVLISIFTDLGFVRFLLKPFNRIVGEKLQPVPSPASFNFKPVVSTTQEFNRLDESINEMMHKIQDAFLIEKEFITNVSHELQTPISIVQSRIENIILEGKVPDDVIVRLTDSQRTLNRMSRIIKALLLISKIENEQYLKQESVQISTLFDEIEEEVEDRLVQRNISLNKLYYEDYIFSPCNKALIFTLFQNLVNNAIKYNKEGGSIQLVTKFVGDRFVVEITDTGIGIEKEQQSAIFDRFKRLNKNNADGFGLGLPIVRTIAAFHHIEIQVESIPDKGTTFRLLFPPNQ